MINKFNHSIIQTDHQITEPRSTKQHPGTNHYLPHKRMQIKQAKTKEVKCIKIHLQGNLSFSF